MLRDDAAKERQEIVGMAIKGEEWTMVPHIVAKLGHAFCVPQLYP